MDPVTAILAFSVAAALLTLTPGLDTALVLRTATIEGPRPAMAAAAGIVSGCLAWGVAAAMGVGALLTLSEVGFRAVQLAGAAYLCWLGLGMLRAAWRGDAAPLAVAAAPTPGVTRGATPGVTGRSARRWYWRGVVTNLLNPKIGVFYISLLPQFIPSGVPVAAFGVGLAGIHAVMGVAWFAALVTATRPLAAWIGRPSVRRGIEGVTGGALIAFGLRLALERRG
jgi:threonine/homoserine/homoserine lactone efflux protein